MWYTPQIFFYLLVDTTVYLSSTLITREMEKGFLYSYVSSHGNFSFEVKSPRDPSFGVRKTRPWCFIEVSFLAWLTFSLLKFLLNLSLFPFYRHGRVLKTATLLLTTTISLEWTQPWKSVRSHNKKFTILEDIFMSVCHAMRAFIQKVNVHWLDTKIRHKTHIIMFIHHHLTRKWLRIRSLLKALTIRNFAVWKWRITTNNVCVWPSLVVGSSFLQEKHVQIFQLRDTEKKQFVTHTTTAYHYFYAGNYVAKSCTYDTSLLSQQLS